MQIEQTRWMQGEGWMPMPPGRLGAKAQLVLLFGSPACLKQTGWQDDIRIAYPAAHRLGCSTAGEISPFDPSAACELHDQTMTITTLSEV